MWIIVRMETETARLICSFRHRICPVFFFGRESIIRARIRNHVSFPVIMAAVFISVVLPARIP